VTLIRGDTVKPQAIEWPWYGYVAAGKMLLLAGASGTGKTTFALGLGGTITIGGRWRMALAPQLVTC
jgi:putative DNA primase/helicase